MSKYLTLDEKIEQLKSMKKQRVEKQKETPKHSEIIVLKNDLEVYKTKWTKLLDMELQEERDRIASNMKRPKEQLIEEGTTIIDLKAESSGKMMVRFSKKSGKLPYHVFVVGESVMLSPLVQEVVSDGPIKGSIFSINPWSILCSVETWTPSHLSRTWRMDKGVSDLPIERMKGALEMIFEEPGHQNQNASKKNYSKGSYVTGIIASRKMSEEEYIELANEKVGLFVPSDDLLSELKKDEKLNVSQRVAIERSINRRISLWVGPPGTGKTTTLIEFIRLCNKIRKGTKIMVAAYTNIAVDNLVEGLLKAGVPALRIGAPEKINPDLVKATLESKCTETKFQAQIDAKKKKIEELQNSVGNTHSLISALRKDLSALKEQMMSSILISHDVVCCTCISAKHDLLEGICFPLVIIDECSQSIEPATLIPIMKGSHQVVLVGDHHQLPPVIISREAVKLGLGKSLFEKLIESGVAPQMLNQQYRMHPGISYFPSKQFYESKLLDGISEKDRPFLPGITWPSKTIPVIFYDVRSPETVSKSSSRYNLRQAQLVIDLVRRFVKGGVTSDNIGVISPYAAQVTVIKKDLPSVEVKTVDGFQGREKDLIILSTVRSGNYQSVDALGFINDWRRMNVSFTRAKSGLIVIGDRSTLTKDKNWDAFFVWLEKSKVIIEIK